MVSTAILCEVYFSTHQVLGLEVSFRVHFDHQNTTEICWMGFNVRLIACHDSCYCIPTLRRSIVIHGLWLCYKTVLVKMRNYTHHKGVSVVALIFKVSSFYGGFQHTNMWHTPLSHMHIQCLVVAIHALYHISRSATLIRSVYFQGDKFLQDCQFLTAPSVFSSVYFQRWSLK